VDLAIVSACFHPETLAGIGFGLPKFLRHFIQIIGDRHDLAVGDADEFVSIRRLRAASNLLVDLTGQLAGFPAGLGGVADSDQRHEEAGIGGLLALILTPPPLADWRRIGGVTPASQSDAKPAEAVTFRSHRAEAVG
jgi:hypothetical protein